MQCNALALSLELRPTLKLVGLPTGTVVRADQAPVALSDEIGELLRIRSVLMRLGIGGGQPGFFRAFTVVSPAARPHN